MKKYPRKIGKWTSYGTFAETEAKWMKNPKFVKAYADLELEFKLINAIIDFRNKKGVTQKKLNELARILGAKLKQKV